MNIKLRLALGAILVLFYSFANASTGDVMVLTNNILIVHFDDGYAVHHKRGQHRTDESVVINPLDVTKAMLLTSYTLQSSDDGNYNVALNPTALGRKTKPTEFGLMCQTYAEGCINSDPDHALEHWIYVYLPKPLQRGKTYTVTLNGLAENTNTFAFTYNEEAMRSEAVHVNNLGYSTAAPAKYGYLYHWAGDKGSLDLSGFDGKNFKLWNTDTKQFVFTGTIAFRKPKTNSETGQASDTPSANFSAADVFECDFTAFNTPGNYVLVADGIGCSFPFAIGSDPYREAFYWTMKGLYQNRSGIALEAAYTEFPRPVPHHPKLTPGFSGRLKYSTFRTFDLSNGDGNAEVDKAKVDAGYKGVLQDTYGWYQDAGDWDGYYTHSHVPAYLLFLYEAGKNKFTDGELDIPESGNGIADVVDEATWLMRYFKRAKDEIKQKGWGTGGVPGARVMGDFWGGDERADGTTKASWEDTDRDWYVLGEDPWTTYKYAALAAQLANIFEADNTTDPLGVNWKQEAIDAYAWAKSHTKETDELKKLDVLLSDTRLYAAAALYRLTGDDAYHATCLKEIATLDGTLEMTTPDRMFGVWMYLLAGNRWREISAYNKVSSLVTGGADKYLGSSAQNRSARWGGDFFFPMLIGQGSTPMITPGIYGYVLNKGKASGTQYLKGIYTTADYFLGCNPLNMTWISGVGERYPVGLFHLDWWYRDKADNTNRFPLMKGIVPYGPWRYSNAAGMGWWDSNWAYSDKAGNPRVYPTDPNQWPGHERWFDMRVSPLSSEFTIHQNTVIAAFVYGFLSAGEVTTLEEGVITATASTEGKPTVTLYPNPTSKTVTVDVPNGIVVQRADLVSSEGKRVRSVNAQGARTKLEIDVQQLPAGNYVLILRTSDAKTITHHIVVNP